MAGFSLRQFGPADLNGIIELARSSFADEFKVQGLTPDALAAQWRLMSRGRMIPIRLLAALTGMRFEIWIAESDGQLVGCGGYSGKRRMLLHTLMVAPSHRRQGIGQALLRKRLERIEAQGYPCATVMALSTNTATLGNLAKQGFRVIDRVVLYERALSPRDPQPKLASRPVVRSDVPLIAELERKTTPPRKLEVEDSLTTHYAPSPFIDAIRRLGTMKRWNRAFLRDGQVIGFLSVSNGGVLEKGLIDGPLVEENDASLFPAMVAEGEAWLIGQGKTALQLLIPEGRTALVEAVENDGWTKLLTWVQLAKWFDGRDQNVTSS